MNRVLERLARSHATSLIVVLLLHGAVLYGLWTIRVIPHMDEAVHVFVNLVSPSSPPSPQSGQGGGATPEPPKPARPIKPVEQAVLRPVEPTQHLLATEAPVEAPAEATAPLPPAEPVADSGPSGLPASSGPSMPAGPVSLGSELALVCPERRPPAYPSLSRRLGETGKVVLRVELDELGRVGAVQVVSGSGFDRLDAAAVAAVRTWRCRPARRDGQAVRSVALQPFDFTLEGN